jgi:hypothetical protein
MQVGYQYWCNVEYFRTVIDRQYRQGPWLLRLPVQFSIVGAVLAAYTVTTVHTSIVAEAALFAAIFGLVVATGVWATKQRTREEIQEQAGFRFRSDNNPFQCWRCIWWQRHPTNVGMVGLPECRPLFRRNPAEKAGVNKVATGLCNHGGECGRRH